MQDKIDVTKIFGCRVFNEDVMQQRLPKDTYKILRKTIDNGDIIDISVANSVANAMKDWAIENGATHYTHWFHPMTGITAEKHDSFISPTADGRSVMEFSGKELIKGEPDASSFPSGGLRATFEARGYTAWDPTSYAFIKDRTLCIPTAFCAYGGQVLDKKTPLLRAMEEINKQALRILRLFGDTTTKRVNTTVGAEQEYFLVDKALYEKRDDLRYTGRTLFGAMPPKRQELSDHYFGAIKPRVAKFMKDLDMELWKYGVFAKTKHNEAAPAQHELAPIYTTTNIATDHNQLTMEVMKNVANEHGLVCLLHEKPFKGVNGSGKHNNWSLLTDTGKNLFKPGDSPQDNAIFLLLLIAIIKGIDEYQDLLRLSVAYAGNDHRLGGGEAPPAIMSIFIGDDLNEIFNSLETGVKYNGKSKERINIGVDVLPNLPKDTTDRNRTSPFAFTGNKFEFRALGSSMSIACPNIIINTIMAEELQFFADKLEGAEDFNKTLNELIIDSYKKHKRIIFNGDGYSKEWEEEAEKRGLLNLKTTTEALPYYLAEKNVNLFLKHKIYTNDEIYSRYSIILDMYYKTIHIEGATMVEMARREIIPAISHYIGKISSSLNAKNSAVPNLACDCEVGLIKLLSNTLNSIYNKVNKLDELLVDYELSNDSLVNAKFCADFVLPAMEELRADVDLAEANTSSNFWPFPNYGDLLFRI